MVPATAMGGAMPGMMEQTMRWFGPRDPVSLADIRQAGCTGVVTALHEVPNGAVWTVEAIAARQAEIAAAGMVWSVVESLPVHETIKAQGPGWEALVDAYRQSLANLAACGLRIVTYNFMPVLDWTRTDLAYELPDGARALRFEMAALAAYDLHILKRPDAARDYDTATIEAAAARFVAMDEAARVALERTVAAGLPGSEESFTGDALLQAIGAYAGIDADRLRANHVAFLRAICPEADRLGIRLVVHPDDPPFPLFGLPRVVSTEADLAALFVAVPNPSNGLCLCTGSLGVRPDNDLPGMARRLGGRVHFVHLRNTRSIADGEFHESEHLSGSVDMYAVVAALHDVARADGRRIAMRPDHGHQMLDDLRKVTNPGYSAIGRLRGLAELRGLELGIARSVAGA
ncbi:mannonate dehydratase [Sphingomonas sp. Leaf339]|uniref:mannonate dehydratase n=1 Tax=Sphingomonas sp. Leaf339 TaxID=1736343 RepID=UPI001F2C467A|nr:mannonate dehydratase [Sphingomonas sp. Leaf339]